MVDVIDSVVACEVCRTDVMNGMVPAVTDGAVKCKVVETLAVLVVVLVGYQWAVAHTESGGEVSALELAGGFRGTGKSQCQSL